MAEKASAAEYVILTTDDPRYEDYDSITGDLAKGMLHDNYACIGDRAEAVRHAIEIAEPGDMIILLVKAMRITKLSKIPNFHIVMQKLR